MSPDFTGHDLKILVAIPSPGVWVANFGLSFAHMFAAANQYRIGNARSQSIQVIHTQGSILARMRMEAVKFALDQQVDYILFVDTDHSFPRKLLHQLIDGNKDVIGCNCVTKTVPSSPTARAKGPDHLGTPVFSWGKTGLERVWRLGTGVMLVKMPVFHRIGYKRTFEMKYNPLVNDIQGEDWTMCEKLEEAGYDIWVDHDLSNEVDHIGQFHFKHHHTVLLDDTDPDPREAEEAPRTSSLILP